MPELSSSADIDGGWNFKRKYISSDRVVIEVHFLQISDSVRNINLCQFGDVVFRDGVGEEDVVFLEMRLLQRLSQKDEVVFGRSDKEDSLQMHQLFLDVLYFLDEIDIVFVQFGLRVNNGDDA